MRPVNRLLRWLRRDPVPESDPTVSRGYEDPEQDWNADSELIRTVRAYSCGCTEEGAICGMHHDCPEPGSLAGMLSYMDRIQELEFAARQAGVGDVAEPPK
jgi:hypothetical protein